MQVVRDVVGSRLQTTYYMLSFLVFERRRKNLQAKDLQQTRSFVNKRVV